jgi:hypothetical protein
MYESHRKPPLSPGRFARRVGAHFLLAQAVVGLSLLAGMSGYRHYEQLPWDDAFLNTAMLLGGMGPVNAPVTAAGKIFAGCFALYAGLVFLIVAAVLVAPVLHRILHKFHWNEAQK